MAINTTIGVGGLFDVAGKKSVQLTSGPFDQGQPVWSPDGTRIAFTSPRPSGA